MTENERETFLSGRKAVFICRLPTGTAAPALSDPWSPFPGSFLLQAARRVPALFVSTAESPENAAIEIGVGCPIFLWPCGASAWGALNLNFATSTQHIVVTRSMHNSLSFVIRSNRPWIETFALSRITFVARWKSPMGIVSTNQSHIFSPYP